MGVEKRLSFVQNVLEKKNANYSLPTPWWADVLRHMGIKTTLKIRINRKQITEFELNKYTFINKTCFTLYSPHLHIQTR